VTEPKPIYRFHSIATFKVSLDDPLNVAFSDTNYSVDVSSWRDGMGPDDDDL